MMIITSPKYLSLFLVLILCLSFVLLLDSHCHFPPADNTGLNILIVPASKQLFQMHQNSFSRIFQINTDSNQFA